MNITNLKMTLAAALATATLLTVPAANAGKANPMNGYINVHDNIMEKGANYGRCNAVGVLAAKVCLSQGLLPVLDDFLVVQPCAALGVDLVSDPEVAPCVEKPCEVLGTC